MLPVLQMGVAISGFDGNGLGLPSRVIEVNADASLELIGVEITDGKAADGDDGVDGALPTNGGDGENGGGIFNEGTLVLRDCKIVFNEAGDGGKCRKQDRCWSWISWSRWERRPGRRNLFARRWIERGNVQLRSE